ncbi:hypothetical protein BDQ12DRAFT_675703 [Crucibulum laeve]|uniref:RRM domain-containing protein n=1 Tax=Crucibulum laeve TaxID=68775 RepID=A0A5C3MGU1_9AGAR|nr:hypothetical protein BDQ12DRAFT_675703 [Crucibulum laeve]
MNVIKEINKINQAELDLGISGASWHDEYKDSAYIFVGGLPFDLTEGDVITIFSQFGEVMDLNMPRDKDTGKPRGFAFLMYEDQRSTVLAVDNLNGAKVLEKTLRVDHVKDYKQPKIKGDDGEWAEPDEQSFNAKPQMILDEGADSDSSASDAASIDPEDPMRDYLIAQRKEEKALKKAKSKSKSKSKGKHKDETPEERRARKARKKEKKEKKSVGVKAVEDLLSSLGRRDGDKTRSRSPMERSDTRRHPRTRSRSPADDDRKYRARSRSPRHSPRESYETRDRRSQQYQVYERDRSPYERNSHSRRTRD